MGDGRGPAAFIVPFYSVDAARDLAFLDVCLAGLRAQSDPEWIAIVIDDCSPSPDVRGALEDVAREHAGRIELVSCDVNAGPGACRNLGIERAGRRGAPFVLFNDHDDISHPERLAVVREQFARDPEVGVVYSTFQVIDEQGRDRPLQELTQSIREILESHRDAPRGHGAWIDIATRTGYTNLTSSTAVRTALAGAVPFPPYWLSEDAHTWLRYSAAGWKFAYAPAIPSRYRIPRDTAGSASRSRAGRREFYEQAVRIHKEGFHESLATALHRGDVAPGQVEELTVRFHLKMAETMLREDERELAQIMLSGALAVSAARARELARGYRLDGLADEPPA